jgi:hypothetical protein
VHTFSNLREPNLYKRLVVSPGNQIATFLKILKHKWLSGFCDFFFHVSSTSDKDVQEKWSCIERLNCPGDAR